MWRLRHKQPCYSLQFYRKSPIIATPGMSTMENFCMYDNLKLTKKSSVLCLCELQSPISPTCQNSPLSGLKQLPRWWRIVIHAATPLVISSNVSNYHIYTTSLYSCLPLPQPQHEECSKAALQKERNAELLDISSSLCVPPPPPAEDVVLRKSSQVRAQALPHARI